MIKTCIHCHQNKPIDNFYAHPHTVDGRLPVCKSCQKERSKLSRKNNKERHNKHCREWRQRNQSPIGTWKKNCPKCGSEQIYRRENTLKLSIAENWPCHKCGAHHSTLPKPIYSRNCPTCKMQIVYSSHGNLKRAIKANSSCCFQPRPPMSDSHRNNISINRKGKCIGKQHPQFGKHFNNETREKMSVARLGKPSGYVMGDEHRAKIRASNLRKIEILGIPVGQDIGAKEWFLKYNNQTNSQFQPRRFFEIGYEADGYDLEKHIWVEYDTKYHLNRQQKKKDILREQRIIKYFEDIGDPLIEFKRVLVYNNNEIITKYRGYGY